MMIISAMLPDDTDVLSFWWFQGAAVGLQVLHAASRPDRQILRLSAAAEGK